MYIHFYTEYTIFMKGNAEKMNFYFNSTLKKHILIELFFGG
jgi:hypothetical protein